MLPRKRPRFCHVLVCSKLLGLTLAAHLLGDSLVECGLPLPTLSLLLKTSFPSPKQLSQLTDIRRRRLEEGSNRQGFTWRPLAGLCRDIDGNTPIWAPSKNRIRSLTMTSASTATAPSESSPFLQGLFTFDTIFGDLETKVDSASTSSSGICCWVIALQMEDSFRPVRGVDGVEDCCRQNDNLQDKFSLTTLGR